MEERTHIDVSTLQRGGFAFKAVNPFASRDSPLRKKDKTFSTNIDSVDKKDRDLTLSLASAATGFKHSFFHYRNLSQTEKLRERESDHSISFRFPKSQKYLTKTSKSFSASRRQASLFDNSLQNDVILRKAEDPEALSAKIFCEFLKDL